MKWLSWIWDVLLLAAVFGLIFVQPAYAKLPSAKVDSCENKVIFVAQVFNAKSVGRSEQWVIKSVTEAQKEFPEVNLNELLVQIRWVYSYKGSELDGEQDFYNRCMNPIEL